VKDKTINMSTDRRVAEDEILGEVIKTTAQECNCATDNPFNPCRGFIAFGKSIMFCFDDL
jgi:hypothetical protein